MSFKWVKGHADNHVNNRSDNLASAGKERNMQIETDEEAWQNNHPAQSYIMGQYYRLSRLNTCITYY